jgi:hypothetical protein
MESTKHHSLKQHKICNGTTIQAAQDMHWTITDYSTAETKNHTHLIVLISIELCCYLSLGAWVGGGCCYVRGEGGQEAALAVRLRGYV